MIKLSAKIRTEKGKKASFLRDSGRIPAVVYGHKTENVMLDVDYKEFQKVFDQAGESSLVELDLGKEKKTVLIHDLQKNPVTDKFTHVDFFEISAGEEVEVEVPLVFEGTSNAVKELGGTLVKSIPELEIRSLPQDLPHEIKVSIDSLNTFEDRILVKDIILPSGVKAMEKPDEIVASVTPPEDVEAELAKEIEEKVEDVEKVKKEEEEEVVDEEEKPVEKPVSEAKPEEKK